MGLAGGLVKMVGNELSAETAETDNLWILFSLCSARPDSYRCCRAVPCSIEDEGLSNLASEMGVV